MPLLLDDLAFISNGLSEALEQLVKGFEITGSYVLSGCVFSGASPNIQISEGWLVLGGEVCYFAGITGMSTLSDLDHFKKATSYDPAGLKTFADAVAKDTYQIITAEFQHTGVAPTDAPNSLTLGNYTTLAQLISATANDALAAAQEGWTAVPAFSNAWESSGTGDDAVSYMKDKQGFVHLKGFLGGESATNGLAFTLPAGYRPSSAIRGMIVAQAGTTFDAAQVGYYTIWESGAVYIHLYGLPGMATYTLGALPTFKAEN